MLVSALLPSLLDSLTYELFFVVSHIGFLVVVELTVLFRAPPRWRRCVRWVLVLGPAVFGALLGRRLLELLPPELL